MIEFSELISDVRNVAHNEHSNAAHGSANRTGDNRTSANAGAQKKDLLRLVVVVLVL
jgi:hypothetical protein